MWPWLCRMIALMSWGVIFEMVVDGVGYNGRMRCGMDWNVNWNGMEWVCGRARMMV